MSFKKSVFKKMFFLSKELFFEWHLLKIYIYIFFEPLLYCRHSAGLGFDREQDISLS